MPLSKPLGLVQFGREMPRNTFGLDKLRAADES